MITRRQIAFGAPLAAGGALYAQSGLATVLPNVYELNRDRFTAVVPGGQYTDPTGLTAHQFQLRAALPINLVQYAFWRLIWTAPSPQPGFETGLVRLYTQTPNTSGPKIPIAYIKSSEMVNPGSDKISNDGVDITNAINNFILAGQSGQIGWDYSGDNSTPVTYISSRLEIGWDI